MTYSRPIIQNTEICNLERSFAKTYMDAVSLLLTV